MHSKYERRAADILEAEKARRALKFLRFEQRTPRWFQGGELDLLPSGERDALYRQLLARERPGRRWAPLVILGASLPNWLRNRTSDAEILWLIVLLGFVLGLVGLELSRRHQLLAKAKRSVRERGDWPLLAQRTFLE